MNPQTQPAATDTATEPNYQQGVEDILDRTLDATERQFELLQRKAKIAAASRAYPDAPTFEAAAIKMMMADTLGIDLMVAMTDIRVYEGKPEISAGLTAALLQREGYEWRFIRYDDKEVSALWWHNGIPLQNADGSQVKFAFTMKQAEKAGYDKRGLDKAGLNNYHKVPENMLFARMITNFTKHHAPHVTRGMSIYAPGEIQMAIADRGPEQFIEPTRKPADEKAVA